MAKTRTRKKEVAKVELSLFNLLDCLLDKRCSVKKNIRWYGHVLSMFNICENIILPLLSHFFSIFLSQVNSSRSIPHPSYFLPWSFVVFLSSWLRFHPHSCLPWYSSSFSNFSFLYLLTLSLFHSQSIAAVRIITTPNGSHSSNERTALPQSMMKWVHSCVILRWLKRTHDTCTSHKILDVQNVMKLLRLLSTWFENGFSLQLFYLFLHILPFSYPPSSL